METSRLRLEQFIEAESVSLTKTLRLYVGRAGLATGSAIGQVADEILSETVEEALTHADRLKPDILTRQWLLGIAANLVKRRKSELARRERREPLVRDIYHHTEATLSDGDLFDMLSSVPETSLEELEQNQQVAHLLAGLSPDDAHIIRLAILHDMDGNDLGRALSTTPGTARVRLYRALNRLRSSLQMRGVFDE
jgi:RNA polymerase sigma factor (sigma-70 family)